MDRLQTDARAPQWVQSLREEITRAIEQLWTKPFTLKGYPTGALLPPAARFRGALAFVEATNRPCYSDGTVWRYMDGSAV